MLEAKKSIMESQPRILDNPNKNEFFPFFPELSRPNSLLLFLQVAGVLQALLVGIPFFLLQIPEAPSLLLNILSQGSLGLLAWYCGLRTPEAPRSFFIRKPPQKGWKAVKYFTFFTLAVLFILSGLFFRAGLALSRTSKHSLYKNRRVAVEALEKKDYRILGERPAGHY
jgi:hypothetical protein